MKKLLTTLIANLSILSHKLTSFAYQIPNEYRPENQPFGFIGRMIEPGENAVGGIILILQIVEGSLLYFAAPIAVIVITIAGLQMIIGGNGEAYGTGKNQFNGD